MIGAAQYRLPFDSANEAAIVRAMSRRISGGTSGDQHVNSYVRQQSRSTLRQLTLLWIAYVAAAPPLAKSGRPVFCLFRRLTGKRCPLCGLTGSTAALVKGNLVDSVRKHPMGPLIIVSSGCWLAIAWVSYVRQVSSANVMDGVSTQASSIRAGHVMSPTESAS
jgi:hypothetical protein